MIRSVSKTDDDNQYTDATAVRITDKEMETAILETIELGSETNSEITTENSSAISAADLRPKITGNEINMKLKPKKNCNGKRITINVAGTKFLVSWETLAKVPNTRLSRLTMYDVDPDEDEIFFERDPTFFPSILGLYYTGQLHFLHSLCGPAILTELAYWEIPATALSPCCKEACFVTEEKRQENQKLADEFGLSEQTSYEEEKRCCGAWRLKLRRFLEDPQSSTWAKIWLFLSLLATVFSFASEAISSVKEYRTPSDFDPAVNNSTFREMITANLSNKELMRLTTYDNAVNDILRDVAQYFFTLDIILRMLSSPGRWHYFKSVLNVVDCVWLVSAWVLYAFVLLYCAECWWTMSTLAFRTIFWLYFINNSLRVFRVVRIGYLFMPLKVIFLTIKASIAEIVTLLFLLILGALIFGPLIYLVEVSNDKSSMYNIPIGYWWAIVTMTTVGYGDRYPSELFGYAVGIVCVTVGLGFSGLPISVISANFSRYQAFAASIKAKKSQSRGSSQESASNAISPELTCKG
ncbi:potassium voltage-gated channel subfamily B member 1-like [Lingula anatina]|uniref:Potassium voltage-gated channel subfamily B member 1-like n=1 Tax=Lingula anatina TaxID=7574 RepID=A0A1S3H3F4_LINAN|nr:potassium voltage-gated channel subfamily B member 1-like [Lingula anatina]|eukprot:XP_013380665.1 potassium voltage-gated channel subfamily B member 1-like [Lingula anatina]